jgi:hypothetical protein
MMRLCAILAGLGFGAWPLLMSRSGLTGGISSLFFSVGSAFVTLIFVLSVGSFTLTKTPHYGYAGFSVAFGVAGMLLFTNMLSEARYTEVGRLIVLTTLVQVIVPIVYQMVVIGDTDPRRMAGVLCALVAIGLLS